MTNEQQRKLEGIQARDDLGYMLPDKDEQDALEQAAADVAALLRMIDQQQAVIAAAREVQPSKNSHRIPGLTGELWVFVREDKLKAMIDALDELDT